ncbi:MAG: hypothetical protein H7145_24610 [Akkermansiaceae bacterium]|nr:hypothetical protein [Armatimonadota bacterium]
MPNHLPPKNTPRHAPPTPRHDRTAQLTALGTGGLNALQRHLLLRHVARCPACRAERERIALLSAGLRALSAAPSPALLLPVTTPDAFNTSLSRFWERGNRFSLPKRTALFAATAALLITAGTVLTTLPGGPLRPTAAFARLEKAMDQVKTAQWKDVTYYAGRLPSKPGEESSIWVRLDEPATSRESPLFAGAAVRERYLTTPHGTLFYAPGAHHYWASDNYSVSESSQANQVNRTTPLRAALRRALLFPRDAAERNSDHTDAPPYKWRESLWESKRTVLNGTEALCFTRRSALYRDDSPFWRKQKPREIRETVYADPETFLIVRRETEQTHGAIGRTLTISHGFRYNVPPPPGTFEVSVPVGRTVLVTQAMLPGGDPVSAPDRRGAQKAVRSLTDARNRNDWDAFAGVYDFGFAPQKHVLRESAAKRILPLTLHRESYPLPARTGSENRVQEQENFRRGKPYRSWRIDGIDSVKYEGTYLYTRRSESDPFPPRTPPDTFAVRARLAAVTRTGRTEKKSASFTVRKTGTDFRVTEIRFVDPPKP